MISELYDIPIFLLYLNLKKNLLFVILLKLFYINKILLRSGNLALNNPKIILMFKAFYLF